MEESIKKPNYLVLDPELAARIGLNEAIVIHQIEYWLDKYKDDPAHIKDGKIWVYNTYEDWQEQFPFWSFHTIRNIFGKMLKKGYLIRGNYNRLNIDRTYWYTINEESIKSEVPICGTSKCQDVADGSANIWQTNTIDYTNDTNTENTFLTASSFDKQSENESNNFLKSTLPVMTTREYIEVNHIMPQKTFVAVIKRFLTMRSEYSNLEYRLTQESLSKSIYEMDAFLQIEPIVDDGIDLETINALMDRFFAIKATDPDLCLLSWNQFCNKNMLACLYADITGEPHYAWGLDGKVYV